MAHSWVGWELLPVEEKTHGEVRELTGTWQMPIIKEGILDSGVFNS